MSRVGPYSSSISILLRRRDIRACSLSVCTEKRPCEDIARRQLSASQKKRSHQKTTLLTPRSWTSSLQNWEKIKFCCLSHPACGICLWQPEQTDTKVVNRISALWTKGYIGGAAEAGRHGGQGRRRLGRWGSRSFIPHSIGTSTYLSCFF